MSIVDTIKSLQYKTPEGFVDFPFCYLYDASALTDGKNYSKLPIITNNDSEFKLRRVVGANLCVNPNATGSFLPYRVGQNPMSQGAIRPGVIAPGGAVSGSWPVLPEESYPAGTQIVFDLNGVLRNVTVDTPSIYNSQIGFWGIRRFQRNNAPYIHKTGYAYRELPFTYTYPLNLNWAHWTDGVNGIATSPRPFYVQILEADFELCAIGVTNADGSRVTTNDFQMQLLDVSGSYRLANQPVNLPYWNYNAPAQYGSPIFPAPSMVWPVKGLVNFEITSMLPFGTNKQFVMHFMGIWRQRA